MFLLSYHNIFEGCVSNPSGGVLAVMYLWKSNKLGKVWIDGDAMRRVVALQLPGGYLCQEASFVGDMDLLNLFISVPEGEPRDKMDRIALLLESRFRGTGINVSIHWTERTKELEETSQAVWKSPLVWAAGAAALVALAQLGFKGLAKSLIAGGVAYGLAWLTVTDEGRKLVRSVVREVRDRR